jgi:hypothetical protein
MCMAHLRCGSTPFCCRFSSMDPTHSFSTSGHGLRQLFGMLPGLQVGVSPAWSPHCMGCEADSSLL